MVIFNSYVKLPEGNHAVPQTLPHFLGDAVTPKTSSLPCHGTRRCPRFPRSELKNHIVTWGFTHGDMAVGQNLVPLVNIKIAGKWMFIPLKMVLIGIDP